MSKQNGSNFKLYVMDGSPTAVKKLIAEQTSTSLTSATNTIDVTSKDNNGFEDFLLGLQTNGATVEMIMDSAIKNATDKVNYIDLIAFKKARTKKAYVAEFTDASLSVSFVAGITKLDVSAPMEDKVSVSMELKQANDSTITTA